MLMTVMVKDIRHQTTLDIKVEHAFATIVGGAITKAFTSITAKMLTNIRWLWEENEGMSMKWV
jgi:deoxyhypusine synthase